jgi:transcriptional regulator with XRE-family HTH domain
LPKRSAARLSGRQIRAARALLRWSADDLSRAAKLSKVTVSRAEGVDDAAIAAVSLESLRSAFEKAGIEFVEDDGDRVGVVLRVSK